MSEARALRERASDLVEGGRPGEALPLAERAAALSAAAGDAEGEGLALFSLAMALGALERHEEALDVHRRTAIRFAELGDTRRLLVIELAWMDALVELGRWEEVIEHAGRALELADSVDAPGLPQLRLRAHYQRARGLALRGDPAAALADTLRAAELAADLGETTVEAQMWLGAADTYAASARYDEAIPTFARALEAALRAGDRRRAAEAEQGLEQVRRLAGESPTSRGTVRAWRGDGDASSREPAAAADVRTVKRVASADFPGAVDPGSDNVLSYAIARQRIYARSAALTISASLADGELIVLVDAPDFAVRDLATGRTANFHRVPMRRIVDGERVDGRFQLTAPEVGGRLDTVVHLRFIAAGLPVGQIGLAVTVGERAASPAGQARAAARLTISAGAPPPPDVVLFVNARPDGRFAISAARFEDGAPKLLGRQLGEFPVTGQAWEYAQALLGQMESANDPAVRVRGIGIDLWENLPQAFRDFYWSELHGRDLSIAICSDEPYIPWELVTPVRDGQVAPMLGAAFSIARWAQDVPLPDPLTVTDMAVVAPDYGAAVPRRHAPLPGAQLEADEMARRFGARPVAGRYAPVTELLRGTAQAIHFAGHGRFDPAAVTNSAIELEDHPLLPTDVRGAAPSLSGRPLVFLNACGVGEQGWGLTHIGGWAAAFCAAGCTAFVGPYWAVDDVVGRHVAEVFYSLVSEADGDGRPARTVGQAMREIRRRFETDARYRHHPTWLAYTLHCHPNVTVRFIGPERARLIAALRSHLDAAEAARDTGPVLSPRAAADAESLHELAAPWPPDAEARYVLGTFHWARWQAHGRDGGAGAGELWTAVTLFSPFQQVRPGLVPEEIREVLDQVQRWRDRADELAEAAEESGDRSAATESEELLRRILSVTAPDDLTRPDHLASLCNTLLIEHELTGDVALLREAIEVGREAVARAPAGHQRLPVYLNALGIALEALHVATGDADALEEAVEASREAVRSGDPGDPLHAGRLSNLGAVLFALHRHAWDLAALAEAERADGEALRLARPDDPARPGFLTNHGLALAGLAQDGGRTGAIAKAVEALREAADLTPPGSRYLPERVHNLANVLAMWHEETGDPVALTEAIEEGRRGLELERSAGLRRTSALCVLGDALRLEYLRSGSEAALDEAVDLCRAAVDAERAGDPRASSSLTALALALKARFDGAGDLAALREAIDVQGGALAIPGLPRAVRAGFVSNLANDLRLLAERDGRRDTLEAAVRTAREALAEMPDDHPARPGVLTNLALALQASSGRDGGRDALEEAVSCFRLAVDVAGAGHPARASFVANLGRALLQRRGSMGEARARLEEAVDTARPSDPARVTYLLNLGTVLRGGDEADRLDAASRFREAAAIVAAPATDRVRAGHALGDLEASAGHWAEAAAAYSGAVALLPRVATRRLERTDRQHELSRFPGLVGDAAAAELEVGRPERAAELLELGRSVLLAQALEPRADLTVLQERAPELYEEFVLLREWLDADVSAAGTAPAYGSATDRRHARTGRWDELLDRIRQVPSLERFLLPLTVGEMLAEATEGPIVLLNVGRHRSDAIVLTAGGVRSVRLPSLTPQALAARTARLVALVEPAAVEELLTWLWDAVVEPVLGLLFPEGPAPGQPAPRLWWSPGSLLGFLPLHAAGRHTGGAPATALDRVVSSYTPTVRALRHARAGRGRPGGEGWMLAVAMPRTPGQADLPDTLPEVLRSGRAFGDVRLLVSGDATRSRVRGALRQSAWAHFACHAASSPHDPGASSLALHDGPLTVAEVMRLRVAGAELAFLSACRTVAATTTLPDEALHIAAAFQVAGYRHVIGTLWEIKDSVAATLAGDVYERLAAAAAGAAGASAALHAAVRALRDRYPDQPHLWAAHVHIGA